MGAVPGSQAPRKAVTLVDWGAGASMGNSLARFEPGSMYECVTAIKGASGAHQANMRGTARWLVQTYDPFGKKFFVNTPLSVDDEFHVAIVRPVVHYTMGGMKVTPDAQAQKEDGAVIPGLFGAGEVNGGIHGENRLGGSSLLDCVVYGRVAGRSAAKHLMETNIGYVRAKM